MAGCGHMGLSRSARKGACPCGEVGLPTSPSCVRIFASFAGLCWIPCISPIKILPKTLRTWTIRISWLRPPLCGRRGDADHRRDAESQPEELPTLTAYAAKFRPRPRVARPFRYAETELRACPGGERTQYDIRRVAPPSRVVAPLGGAGS